MTENNHQSEDYISLQTLKNFLKDFIGFLVKAIAFLLGALRRYLVLIIACMLLGMGAAFGYFALKDRFYESEMVVQQSFLNRRVYVEIVNNLNDLIATQSYADLAAALKMDHHAVSQIVLLQAVGMGNESLDRDTTQKLGLPFKIQAKATDNSIFPQLEKSLYAYLNENPFVKKSREGRKKIFLEKLAFINEELNKLDSLKDIYNQSLSSLRMPASVYNNGLNPADLYRHSLTLATQKESILNWLNTEAEGIQLIDGFKKPDHPVVTRRKRDVLILGGTAGLLLGLGLALLLALNSRLR